MTLRILPSWYPYTGMALWPVVLLRKTASARTLHHERIHLAQQTELLLIGFYVLYLWEFLYHLYRLRQWDAAYRAISFEREAFDNENRWDYLAKRKDFAWKRYWSEH